MFIVKGKGLPVVSLFRCVDKWSERVHDTFRNQSWFCVRGGGGGRYLVYRLLAVAARGALVGSFPPQKCAVLAPPVKQYGSIASKCFRCSRSSEAVSVQRYTLRGVEVYLLLFDSIPGECFCLNGMSAHLTCCQ